MFKFGKHTDPQEQFIVNKGNVKMVSEGDFKVAFDEALSGHVAVTTSADTVRVEVSKDVPNASIYLNAAEMQHCKVSVGSGILEVKEPGPDSDYRLASGSLDAKLEKARMGAVKAKVNVGVLSNSSDLAEVPSDFDMVFGHNPFAGVGMCTTLELMGDVQGSSAIFEVGSGTMNLHE